MKLLDKITESGSLQLAMLLTAAMVAMLVMEQCGIGYASREFVAFVLSVDGVVLGTRSKSK